MRKYLPWILVAIMALTFAGVVLGPKLFTAQFYLVTIDDGTTYVATLHGQTYWRPVRDAYILRDVYFVRAADPKNPQAGFQIFQHDKDVYWPWQTLIPERRIRTVEPIQRESPIGKMIAQAQGH